MYEVAAPAKGALAKHLEIPAGCRLVLGWAIDSTQVVVAVSKLAALFILAVAGAGPSAADLGLQIAGSTQHRGWIVGGMSMQGVVATSTSNHTIHSHGMTHDYNTPVQQYACSNTYRQQTLADRLAVSHASPAYLVQRVDAAITPESMPVG